MFQKELYTASLSYQINQMINYIKKKMLFFLFIFSSICAIGQDSEIDSLEQLIASDAADTVRLEAMLDLGWAYVNTDVDKSISAAQQLLMLSKKLHNERKEAMAYNLLGLGYNTKHYDLDTIINVYQKGIVIAEKLNRLNFKANVINNMALAYSRIGQRDKAFALHQEALILAEEVGKKATAVRCLNNMAVVLKDDGEFEKAKKYYLKGLVYAKELKNQRFIAYLTNNLALIYYNTNQRDSALILHEAALEIKRAIKDEHGMVTSLANIGELHSDMGKYEIADQYFLEGYEIARKLKYRYGLGLTLTDLGASYLNQKKYNRAIQYAEQAIEALGENGNIDLVSLCYSIISDSYEGLGSYQLAFDNQKIFHQLTDSIYNLNKEEQINKLEIQYTVAQKETENKLLKAEKIIASKTIRNTTLLAIGLVLALVMALGWGGLVYQSNRQKKKMNEVLEAKVKERTKALEISNQHLEQANYELRTFNYIASHDIKEPIRNIGNYAGLAFRKLPEELKKSLGHYFETIKKSTVQLYTLVEDFARYTTLSKNDSLEMSEVDLNILVNSVKDNLQTTIESGNGNVVATNLPIISSNSSLLYVALKNLIENGLKYNQSAAPTVKVSYLKTATHHQIIVSDNGIGIEAAYHEKVFEMFKRLHNRSEYEGSGIGLAIVKLVIEKLNGEVQIKSEIGTGSQFIILIEKN